MVEVSNLVKPKTSRPKCNHLNTCYYRRMSNGNKAFSTCDYMIITFEPRGCPADDCNKYEPKVKLKQVIK